MAGVILTIAPTERQLVYKIGFLAPYAQCVKRVYFLLFASPIMPIFGYVIGVRKRRSRIQSCEDLEAFLRGLAYQQAVSMVWLMFQGSSYLSAGGKLKFQNCTPCWVMCLEKGWRALSYSPHVDGTSVMGQDKSLHKFLTL